MHGSLGRLSQQVIPNTHVSMSFGFEIHSFRRTISK
jgi:hypothetical protein